jgi:CRISPR-associated endonuclease Csy4
MDSYIDIHIRPDPEFPVNQLMSVLFRKLHLALADLESTDIGVSFPKFGEHSLGNWLRLHGASSALSSLMAKEWLSGIHDHIQKTDVMPVPQETKYRSVRRVQAKSSPERLRRRAMRRHCIDQVAAVERIPDSVAKHLSLPYLNLVSRSTDQHFRLFVRHGPVQDISSDGSFSSYGFSDKGTIPWF